MSLEERIGRLVACFPWTEREFPSRPAPGREREAVEAWLEEKARPHARMALLLTARLRPVIEEVERSVRDAGAKRFVARIDTEHLRKTGASILQKMARRWDGSGPVPCGFHDFDAEFDDLGRLRIVANYLSDARAVRSALEAPFRTPPPPALTAHQAELRDEFRLRDNAFTDLVNVPVKDRGSAARCLKGIFMARAGTGLRVEVQIMTQLQEAWDAKEHNLRYERRRTGEDVPVESACDLEAMSALLYVADRTFDHLRDRLSGGGR